MHRDVLSLWYSVREQEPDEDQRGRLSDCNIGQDLGASDIGQSAGEEWE